MASKKRFIAGATCPKCKQIDRIVTYNADAVEYRECVACGFTDKLQFKPQLREMQTRVNTSPEEVEQETQVVRIFGPPPKSS